MKFSIVFQNKFTGINIIFHLGSLFLLSTFVWSENFIVKPRLNWLSKSLSYLAVDVLTPYIYTVHGSRLNHRDIRECAAFETGSRPHETLSPSNLSIEELNNFEARTFRYSFNSYTVYGHYTVVSDPSRRISVLEPRNINGCASKVRETVLETSKQKQCVIAMNAGYFNVKTGACLGNIVTDGKLVQSSGGIQNAHFGIKKDGSLLVGYISEEDVVSGNFLQLVGGVVWTVRNGSNFVNSSMQLECSETEDTGSMTTFVNVKSARTSIGYDSYGNVILAQVEGKTNLAGASLWDMAEIMIKLGAINAINLDGGGSSTFIVNNTVVSYPSDDCQDNMTCARDVSTVLCAHYPECDPPDCNGHGTCKKGICHCNPATHWSGPKCDVLDCKNNSYCHPGKGVCGPNGCICNPGWIGKHCNQSCSVQKFGKNCKQNCFCLNGASCDPVNGRCHCSRGYYGHHCEKECPPGYYGFNCEDKCFCDQSCFCNHITGACTKPDNSSKSIIHCLMRNSSDVWKFENTDSNSNIWKYATLALALSTALSLGANMVLLCCSCSCSCKHRQPPALSLASGSSLSSALQSNPWGLKASGLAVLKTKKPYRPVRLADILASSSTSSSSEEDEEQRDWGRVNSERITKMRAS